MWSNRVFAILVVGACCILAGFWFLTGPVTIDGVDVPVNLDNLVERADTQADYQPPNQVIVTTREANSVSQDTLDQIERVTGQRVEHTGYVTNSWSRDGFYGFVAALALIALVVVIIGLVFSTARAYVLIGGLVLAFVATALIAFVIGAYVGELFNLSEVEYWNMFWRGVGAALMIPVALVLGNIVDVTVPD